MDETYWLQLVVMVVGVVCARKRRSIKKSRRLGETVMTGTKGLIEMIPAAIMVSTTLAAIIVVVTSSDIRLLYGATAIWSVFYCGYIVWALLESQLDLLAEVIFAEETDDESDDKSEEQNDGKVD